MRYRFAADVEAVQFDGDNHTELRDFIGAVTSAEHISYRQMGHGNPLEFDAASGLRVQVSPSDWLICLDGKVEAVSDEWFRRHCTPVD